ncbi:hypothetical protein G6O69_26545 [Pseudenhygromyxa sp. WMMC2535]|uniref:hypothetical protein n=1 Tax=Pseudenhygromyxa sp. WMMC2535 TaxID=2712867 RepID=UPI001554F785|nr:hypothetical protein [Pseudenhygromyxa sp. WMMC2535]NVB41426.1 hypothetical protein [Pseudenhygromyxa sp. WMMC2535]
MDGRQRLSRLPQHLRLRGTPYRDPLDWAGTVAAMLAYEPAALIPQHGVPVVGASEVQKMLTDYHDAIAFVHDQTIRYMAYFETQ